MQEIRINTASAKRAPNKSKEACATAFATAFALALAFALGFAFPLPTFASDETNADLNQQPNVTFSAPTSVNMVLKPDGSLIGPTSATIDNQSAYGMWIVSAQAQAAQGWHFVSDSSADTNDNAIQLSFGIDGDMIEACDCETDATPTAKELWHADAGDSLALRFTGKVTKLTVNAATPQPVGILTWLAEFDVPDPADGEAYGVLDDSGELTLFRSNNAYEAGPGQKVRDLFGNEYEGRVYVGVESTAAATSVPWHSQASSVKTFRVASGQRIEPASTAYWFSGCTNLTDCNLNGLDTSASKSMQSMFSGCSTLGELDVGSLDTSAATSLRSMFQNCSSLQYLDLSSFETSSAKSMRAMFNSCTALASVKLGQGFNFKGNGISQTANMAVLPTPNSNGFTGRWVNDSVMEADSVTAAELRDGYDGSATARSLGPGAYIWERATDGSAYAVLDDSATLTFFRSRHTYDNDTDQTVIDLLGTEYTGRVFAGIETTGPAVEAVPWNAQRDAIAFVQVASSQTIAPKSTAFWFDECTNMTVCDLFGLDMSGTDTMRRMFGDCDSLDYLDLWDADSSHATDMGGMFDGCDALKSVLLGENFSFKGAGNADEDHQAILPMPPSSFPYFGKWLNTTAEGAQGVTSEYLRDNYDGHAVSGSCSSGLFSWEQVFRAAFDANGGGGTMETLVLDDASTAPECGFDPPTEKIAFLEWNTRSDGRGKSYAAGDSLPCTADLKLYAQWVGPREGTAYAVLENDGTLTLFRSKNVYETGAGQTVSDLLGNEYTGHVYAGIEDTRGQQPWEGERAAITSVSVADKQTIAPKRMDFWFHECVNLTMCSLEGLDTSQTTRMPYLFRNCTALTNLDLSYLKTQSLQSISSAFEGCASLSRLDVSNWNTTKLDEMQSTFANCTSLVSLDLSNWDTANVTNARFAFMDCRNLAELDISSWVLPKLKSAEWMFLNCSDLAYVDVSQWDTSNLENINLMFQNCYSLTSLDVSKWNTSRIESMLCAFNNCSGLKQLDVSKWDTSRVGNMSGLFNSCSSLTTLDVSKWDTSASTTMHTMFSGCSSLTSLDVSNFDTSNVTDMMQMFIGLNVSSLDVSRFDTSNVMNLRGMFQACPNISHLDLSNFDTSQATDMQLFLADNDALERITLGERFSFRGNNIADPHHQAILPDPPSVSPYTGRWLNADVAGANGITSANLRDNYEGSAVTGDFARGTYVWEREG